MPGATVTGADFMRDLTVSGESVSAALENWTVSALEK